MGSGRGGRVGVVLEVLLGGASVVELIRTRAARASSYNYDGPVAAAVHLTRSIPILRAGSSEMFSRITHFERRIFILYSSRARRCDGSQPPRRRSPELPHCCATEQYRQRYANTAAALLSPRFSLLISFFFHISSPFSLPSSLFPLLSALFSLLSSLFSFFSTLYSLLPSFLSLLLAQVSRGGRSPLPT